MRTGNKNEEAIFAAAIEIESAAERESFVKSACGQDSKLLARVESLLKVYYEDKDFLKSPPGVNETIGNAVLSEGPGTRIDRYKLLQMIGEGGFGVVYMAEQEEPIRRRVALKIIKLGMDTKKVIARFEAERQALAMMEHPNIAKVLDAGATETGRPYFVMELVRGIPITDYCDKNNLDTRQRLQLFIDVCKAIQHAHQKGIIHRDIKPSNVLITLRDDDSPVPKIIDFGIAKATQARLTEKTLFTEFKQFIGTPEYMSPEQTQMRELDVDTRSDIYSLGVLLYELLTGTTPFEAERLRSAAFDEIVRIIREEEPDKPSTRLNTLGEALTDVAKHRQVGLGELCKLLRGDLDWIVMKTLEKDRTRRYETANELAMDIERHLSDEPVSAGPPGVGYRVGKFVRRHRTGVAAGLLVAAALVIGLCLSLIGFVQASRQRDRAIAAEAEATWHRYLAEEQRQRATVNFQMALDAVGEMTAVAEKELAGFPEMEQRRRELLDKAKVFYEGFLEENSDDPTAIGQIGLAYDHIGDIHFALGQYKQSVQAFRDATEVFEKLAAESIDAVRWQEELAWSNQHMAWVLRIIGRNEEAENACRNAIVVWEKMAIESPNVSDHQDGLGQAYVTLGTVLERRNQLDEAVEAYREARKVIEKLAGDFPDEEGYHVWLYWNCWMLRVVLTKIGRLAEAEDHYRQAVLASEKLTADFPDVWRHRWDLAYAKNELGLVLKSSGQLEEAEESIRQAAALFEKRASDFPNVASHRYSLGHTLRGLGEVLQDAGKLEESEQARQRAIAVFEKLVADSSGFKIALGQVYDELGLLLSETGRNEEAKDAYESALAIKKELIAHQPGNPDFVRGLFKTRFQLVKVQRDAGQLEEAEANARQSVEELEKWVEDFPDSPAYTEDLAKARRNLSDLLEANRQWKEVEK